MIKRLIVPGILALGLTACNQETEPIIRTTDPQAIKITVSDQSSVKFDYTLPLPSSDDDKPSAVKTQDILFAYN